MKRFSLFATLLMVAFHAYSQNKLKQDSILITPFESSLGKESATYAEAMLFYWLLDGKYENIQMQEAGPTDTRYPLNVVYYSGDKEFDIKKWKAANKVILLINNGIHPGEPDGIDACMMLMRDAAQGKIKIPSNVVLAVIPVFNIGGALNRNGSSRANQNGPKEYGFRGNAQNLDLNRDFIKLDAKETQSLVQLFHQLDPDLFIDNHVSDGADYQHVMTLLATQHNKLGANVGKYMYQTLEPALFADMKKRNYDMVPYVNDFEGTPDSGWTEFYDPPRFSSGFASQFQTFAFVPETHMLKPFKKRVKATYALMQSFIKIAGKNAGAIKDARKKDREALLTSNELVLDWKPDTSRFDKIPFKGYTAGYKPSKVSGLPRLYYDRERPCYKEVCFYNHYKPTLKVTAPVAYIIRQGWNKVIERLKWNGVEMSEIKRDTIIELGVYYIDKYETGPRPYEGHYPHRNVQIRKEKQKIKLLSGDMIVYTNQPAKRYIVETLEPNAPDAFFVWNFFDAILQQKEYFGDYVFEDLAAEMIKKDKTLADMLHQKQKTDTAFAKNKDAQLDFVYRHSAYYEPTHNRYPVSRLE